MIQKLRVLVQIAWRNLFASWLNVIIGMVILGGTFLVVVGGSALDSLDRSMSQSITGAVSGDLQVYSAKSKDELAMFGGGMGGEPDMAVLPSFAKIKNVLSKVPNVRAVVPMGEKTALITSGNTVDVNLARLREAVKAAQAPDAPAEVRARVESLKTHVRHLVEVLKAERKNADKLMDESAKDPRNEEAIARASSDEFWAGFDADPFGSLEYLENRIAPLLSDGDMVFLRYVGTDLPAFQKAFDRMQIVDGTAVPEGHRGMLMPKFFYEDSFKLKSARRLDQIKEEMEENHSTIAKDGELQRLVKENRTQTREILFQLDPLKSQQAAARLQKALGSQEKDLEKLLVQLFDTNDQNFQEHYRIFYSELAPLLELYRLRIGDPVTIKTFTSSGYAESQNVKVYGTFDFKGLEKSPLAGTMALMDLVTFRDLYGYLTAAQKAEIARLKAQSGAKDISREDAEAALFGEGSDVVQEGKIEDIDEAAQMAPRDAQVNPELATFTQQEIDDGILLNAAVMLEDPSRSAQTVRDIEQASKDHGLDLKVVTWQQASGMIGQLVQYLRYAMYIIAAIIFLVAMVILSNAVLMATLQRVREIGTMRAIGAQRGFVRLMISVETLALGTAFGGLGLLLGSGLVALLGRVGIPAANRQLYFFFAGPRWFPQVSLSNVGVAYLIVLVVSILSTLYPAIVATRVSPVVAMSSED